MMIGGPTDVVVEANIVRGAAPAREAPGSARSRREPTPCRVRCRLVRAARGRCNPNLSRRPRPLRAWNHRRRGRLSAKPPLHHLLPRSLLHRSRPKKRPSGRHSNPSQNRHRPLHHRRSLRRSAGRVRSRSRSLRTWPRNWHARSRSGSLSHSPNRHPSRECRPGASREFRARRPPRRRLRPLRRRLRYMPRPRRPSSVRPPIRTSPKWPNGWRRRCAVPPPGRTAQRNRRLARHPRTNPLRAQLPRVRHPPTNRRRPNRKSTRRHLHRRRNAHRRYVPRGATRDRPAPTGRQPG